MGFGNAVSTLLDTYTNCLALLKAFKRRSPSADLPDEQQSLLRRSIRSDRTKVRRAYESRLSQCGSRLVKGDGPSKSILRRILRKLSDAIRRLLQMASRSQDPVLDYNSLLSLSNSSRVDAIRAMDQLSVRLSSSRSSVASSSQAVSRPRHRRSTSSSTSTSTVKSQSAKDDVKIKNKDKSSSKDKEPAAKHRPASGGEARLPSRSSSDQSKTLVADESTSSRVRYRMSMTSVSTNSTKIGEIPQRKLHRRGPQGGTVADEYKAQVAYPLRPFAAVEPKEKKGWSFWRR